MNKKTVRDIDLKDKKVLVRCDFNVPMDENKNITDNRRIVAALPTIQYLLEQNCKIVLCSHLGRPKGEFKPEFSLAPVAKELSKQLNKEVIMAKDVIGEDACKKAKKLNNGEILLLENLRFHREETDNDPEFAKKLAEFGEVFVNDAFGTAHRAHASTEGVTKYLPAVSGFLIEKELEFLGAALENPKRPYVAILGGAKVSDKIGVIDSLLEKVDTLIIGGGMAYTFFKAQGHSVGDSLCEDDKCDLALELMNKAKEKGVKMLLPIDTKIGKEFKPDTESKTVAWTDIPDGWQGFDISKSGLGHNPRWSQRNFSPLCVSMSKSSLSSDSRTNVLASCSKNQIHRLQGATSPFVKVPSRECCYHSVPLGLPSFQPQ